MTERPTFRAALTAAAAVLALAYCAKHEDAPANIGVGPDPQLPAPDHDLIPAVDIAPPIGWGQGQTPKAMQGLKVAAFVTGLEHPRWLYVLPNGDVLVAESNGRPEPTKRPKDMVMKAVMKKAGAAAPSADRITLLRDTDHDGVPETRTVFLKDLKSPFGMALVGHDLYVAYTDSLWRFPYAGGETAIAAPGVKVMDLPGGPINHHWTKNVVASRDGSKLYVTVGSNSNVGENGLDQETGRAAIWEVDRASGRARIFASGLRNPNGLDWEPESGALWTVVNERDELGDNLVPDYLTSVKDGAFYGWPYSYWGQHVDARVKPQRPDLVARATRPDYGLGSHAAPLGMTFSGTSVMMGGAHGAFVGLHGSWNRSPPNGYKVVFIPFAGGRPNGMPVDVLSGFVTPEGRAHGRPVGVAVDPTGALLVADDVGNTVWRVTAATGPTAPPAS